LGESNLSVLTAIKRGLEKPEKGLATATGTLRDLLIVTWAVPEEKLRSFVPESLPLDRLPTAEGLCGFVQFTCALHEATRWSPLPEALGDSYHRADVRVLVRPESGDPGAFVVASYISAPGIVGALYPVAKGADEGRFKFHLAGNPAIGSFTGGTVRVSTDGTQAEIVVKDAPQGAPTTPFGTWESLTPYFTNRPSQLWAARVGAGLTLFPTHHEPLTPQPGVLVSAQLAALPGIDLTEAVAVHYQTTLASTAYPPRKA
jgi:Uncharacterized conserved protein (COG2071)